MGVGACYLLLVACCLLLVNYMKFDNVTSNQ